MSETCRSGSGEEKNGNEHGGRRGGKGTIDVGCTAGQINVNDTKTKHDVDDQLGFRGLVLQVPRFTTTVDVINLLCLSVSEDVVERCLIRRCSYKYWNYCVLIMGAVEVIEKVQTYLAEGPYFFRKPVTYVKLSVRDWRFLTVVDLNEAKERRANSLSYDLSIRWIKSHCPEEKESMLANVIANAECVADVVQRMGDVCSLPNHLSEPYLL